MANFPNSLPALTNPLPTTRMNVLSHSVAEHSAANDEITAIATKLGIGATTPVANSVLAGTGTGTSAWTTGPTLVSLTVTGALTVATMTLSGDPGLTLAAAASRIVPGATSMSLRNNANNADNLIITDAGVATIRAGLTVTAGGAVVTAGGLSATGAASPTVGTGKLINSTASGVGMALMLSNLAANNVANSSALGFSMNNSTPTEFQFGEIRVTSTAVTAASETGTMLLRVISVGTMFSLLTLSGLATGATASVTGVGAFGLAVGGTLVGVSTRAISSGPTYGATVTSFGGGVVSSLTTAAASFTMTNGYDFYANQPTIGAASAVTTMTGYYSANMGASGITNAIGVDIAAQSGASGLNIGLRNAGTSTLTGAVTTGSTLQIGSRGAFAASDKYLICDASGNVHVSALGPAS